MLPGIRFLRQLPFKRKCPPKTQHSFQMSPKTQLSLSLKIARAGVEWRFKLSVVVVGYLDLRSSPDLWFLLEEIRRSRPR